MGSTDYQEENSIDLIRPLQRSWFYFQKGYGTYPALPIGLTSVDTTVYYLAIQSLPNLTKIFPKFHNFLLIFPLIYPIGAVMGWIHYRKSNQYQQEQEIVVTSNPYSTIKIAPVSFAPWKLFSALARKEGLNDVADQMDEIIRRSQQ